MVAQLHTGTSPAETYPAHRAYLASLQDSPILERLQRRDPIAHRPLLFDCHWKYQEQYRAKYPTVWIINPVQFII